MRAIDPRDARMPEYALMNTCPANAARSGLGVSH